MKETVWLRRETGVNDALRRAEVLLPQAGVDLGIFADLMKMAQESFLEDGTGG